MCCKPKRKIYKFHLMSLMQICNTTPILYEKTYKDTSSHLICNQRLICYLKCVLCKFVAR
jgi:hypothetical protein